MPRLILVRHGQASFGELDYDRLSQKGVAQARHLGTVMRERGETIDRLWHGPMRRHRETAQAWLETHGPVQHVQEHALFREFDHHDVIACHEPRFRDHEVLQREFADPSLGAAAFAAMFKIALARWQSGLYDAEYTETWTQFQARCLRGLEDVAVQGGKDELHCVVTSGGVISAIVQHMLGLTDAATMQLNWNLINASITWVQQSPRGNWTLISYNEHGHFRGEHRDLLSWR